MNFMTMDEIDKGQTLKTRINLDHVVAYFEDGTGGEGKEIVSCVQIRLRDGSAMHVANPVEQIDRRVGVGL